MNEKSQPTTNPVTHQFVTEIFYHLLGEVIPCLRAIYVHWKPGLTTAKAIFYIDREKEGDITFYLSGVIVEIEAGILPQWENEAVFITEEIKTVYGPIVTPPDCTPVYLRKEPFINPTIPNDIVVIRDEVPWTNEDTEIIKTIWALNLKVTPERHLFFYSMNLDPIKKIATMTFWHKNELTEELKQWSLNHYEKMKHAFDQKYQEKVSLIMDIQQYLSEWEVFDETAGNFFEKINETMRIALLGEVIPALRRIALDWREDWDAVEVAFFHDGDITQSVQNHYLNILNKANQTKLTWKDKELIFKEKLVAIKYPKPLPRYEAIKPFYLRTEPFVDPID